MIDGMTITMLTLVALSGGFDTPEYYDFGINDDDEQAHGLYLKAPENPFKIENFYEMMFWEEPPATCRCTPAIHNVTVGDALVRNYYTAKICSDSWGEYGEWPRIKDLLEPYLTEECPMEK